MKVEIVNFSDIKKYKRLDPQFYLYGRNFRDYYDTYNQIE